MADLLVFASAIHEGQIFEREDDLIIQRRCITDLLSQAIENTDYFFVPRSRLFELRSYFTIEYTKPGPPKPDIAFQHFRECVRLGNPDLTRLIAQKLTITDGISSEMLRTRMTHVFIPLIALVGELSMDLPGYRYLYQRTASLRLDDLQSRTLTAEDVEWAFRAAAMEDDETDFVFQE